MTTYRIFERSRWAGHRWFDWDDPVEAESPEAALDMVAYEGGWASYADWRRNRDIGQMVALPELAGDDDWEFPGYDGPRCVECGCPVDDGNACSSCLSRAIAVTERYEEVAL